MSNLFPGALKPLGFQQIVAATLAASTPLTVPTGASFALIQCDTAPVRWRQDGTAPTSAIGMTMNFGLEPQGFYANLSALRFIAESGSPVLNVAYYG